MVSGERTLRVALRYLLQRLPSAQKERLAGGFSQDIEAEPTTAPARPPQSIDAHRRYEHRELAASALFTEESDPAP